MPYRDYLHKPQRNPTVVARLLPDQIRSSLSQPHTRSSPASNKPPTSGATSPFILGKANKTKSMPFLRISLSFSKAWGKHLGSRFHKYTVRAALAMAYVGPWEHRNAREYAETFSNPTVTEGLLTQAHTTLHPQLSNRPPAAPWTSHRNVCMKMPRALLTAGKSSGGGRKTGEDGELALVPNTFWGLQRKHQLPCNMRHL